MRSGHEAHLRQCWSSRVVISNGEPVSTGIFKEPRAGLVMLRTLNLDGDRQADLFPFMAGQAKRSTSIRPNTTTTGSIELPEMKLPWGIFGEIHDRGTF